MIQPLFVLWFLGKLAPSDDDRSLQVTFGGWLLTAFVVGFSLTVASGYVIVTEREKQLTASDMVEEIEYLDTQREAVNKWSWIYNQANTDSDADISGLGEYFKVQSMLEGYEVGLDGIVVVAYGEGESANVIASDDPRIKVGSTFKATFGKETLDAIDASLEDGKMHTVPCENILLSDDSDISATQLGYLVARVYEGKSLHRGYLYLIIRPAPMVFADREQVVLWVTVCTAVLLAMMYIMVSHLLRDIVLSSVDRVNEELGLICEGKLDTVVTARGSKEFVGLSQGINTTVDALKEWIAEARRRIEKELATARAIQSSALPSLFPPFPEIDEFDLYASMDPAREVGGDFYDFFLLEDGVLAFLIADVSGKGIPGALFMMEARSELSNYLRAGMDLAEAVAMANSRLCEGNDAGMFVTVWVGALDYRRGVLTYVNAGHNPPLVRHDGSWRWLNDRSGLFLGTFDMVRYKSFELKLEPGDELLLYTDGVNEAFDVNGTEYGNDRLEAFLADNVELGPKELVEGLRASVAAWAVDAEQSDDITILALEYHHGE